jgi:hypothetical protein
MECVTERLWRYDGASSSSANDADRATYPISGGFVMTTCGCIDEGPVRKSF